MAIPLIDGFDPLGRPLGDGHHTEEPFTAEDEIVAKKLAWHMGTMHDHFANADDLWRWWYSESTSQDEWKRVARALRIHGLKIVNAGSQ
jgi:hypothetical protein